MKPDLPSLSSTPQFPSRRWSPACAPRHPGVVTAKEQEAWVGAPRYTSPPRPGCLSDTSWTATSTQWTPPTERGCRGDKWTPASQFSVAYSCLEPEVQTDSRANASIIVTLQVWSAVAVHCHRSLVNPSLLAARKELSMTDQIQQWTGENRRQQTWFAVSVH